MYHITELENTVFREPYMQGRRKLKVLSGYASSAFLTHIVNNYPELSLELIIGMASKDGISDWDHERFKEISRKHKHVDVKYQRTLPAIHSKIYHWYKENEFDTQDAFIGSSNFSWAGFRDQIELMGKVAYPNISDVFSYTDTISCTDKDAESEIRINQMEIEQYPDGSIGIRMENGAEMLSEERNLTELKDMDSVKLSLLTKNNTEIHERAGLNWGQREVREPNQAYIPVPSGINREREDFFPPFRHPFTLLTDDGEQMNCIMAQANRKAIQTTDANSILGKYFRRRLGVPYGDKVNIEDLARYGRTDVTIYKLNNEIYFMDFGPEF